MIRSTTSNSKEYLRERHLLFNPCPSINTDQVVDKQNIPSQFLQPIVMPSTLYTSAAAIHRSRGSIPGQSQQPSSERTSSTSTLTATTTSSNTPLHAHNVLQQQQQQQSALSNQLRVSLNKENRIKQNQQSGIFSPQTFPLTLSQTSQQHTQNLSNRSYEYNAQQLQSKQYSQNQRHLLDTPPQQQLQQSSLLLGNSLVFNNNNSSSLSQQSQQSSQKTQSEQSITIPTSKLLSQQQQQQLQQSQQWPYCQDNLSSRQKSQHQPCNPKEYSEITQQSCTKVTSSTSPSRAQGNAFYHALLPQKGARTNNTLITSTSQTLKSMQAIVGTHNTNRNMDNHNGLGSNGDGFQLNNTFTNNNNSNSNNTNSYYQKRQNSAIPTQFTSSSNNSSNTNSKNNNSDIAQYLSMQKNYQNSNNNDNQNYKQHSILLQPNSLMSPSQLNIKFKSSTSNSNNKSDLVDSGVGQIQTNTNIQKRLSSQIVQNTTYNTITSTSEDNNHNNNFINNSEIQSIFQSSSSSWKSSQGQESQQPQKQLQQKSKLNISQSTSTMSTLNQKSDSNSKSKTQIPFQISPQTGHNSTKKIQLDQNVSNFKGILQSDLSSSRKNLSQLIQQQIQASQPQSNNNSSSSIDHKKSEKMMQHSNKLDYNFHTSTVSSINSILKNSEIITTSKDNRQNSNSNTSRQSQKQQQLLQQQQIQQQPQKDRQSSNSTTSRSKQQQIKLLSPQASSLANYNKNNNQIRFSRVYSSDSSTKQLSSHSKNNQNTTVEQLLNELVIAKKQRDDSLKEQTKLAKRTAELERMLNESIKEQEKLKQQQQQLERDSLKESTCSMQDNYEAANWKKKYADGEKALKQAEAEYAGNIKMYKDQIMKNKDIYNKFEQVKKEKEEAISNANLLRNQINTCQLELDRAKLQTITQKYVEDDLKTKVQSLQDALRASQQEVIDLQQKQKEIINGNMNANGITHPEDGEDNDDLIEEVSLSDFVIKTNAHLSTNQQSPQKQEQSHQDEEISIVAYSTNNNNNNNTHSRDGNNTKESIKEDKKNEKIEESAEMKQVLGNLSTWNQLTEQRLQQVKDDIQRHNKGQNGQASQEQLDKVLYELEETTKQLLSANQSIVQVKEENNTLKKQLNECQGELGEVYRLMNQKKRDADSAIKELKEEKVRQEGIQGHSRAQETELLCLRETYENVSRELEQTITQLETERKSKEQLMMELHVKNRYILELASELEVLKIKYEDLGGHLSSLQNSSSNQQSLQQQQSSALNSFLDNTKHSRVITKMTFSRAEEEFTTDDLF